MKQPPTTAALRAYSAAVHMFATTAAAYFHAAIADTHALTPETRADLTTAAAAHAAAKITLHHASQFVSPEPLLL